MARTRRAIIRSPTPSPEATPSFEQEEASSEERSPSPEPPPRLKRRHASSSRREESPPQYDTTRFTSLENQQWYEAGLAKELIHEKHLAPEVDDHYKISEAFGRLGWKPILNLPRYYFPNLVREFYANVEDKGNHSPNEIISWVRGKRLEIDRATIAKYAKVRDQGWDVNLTKEFRARDPWQVGEAVARLKGTYKGRGSSQKLMVYADSFDPRLHLLLYLFAHNVVPKKSGKREVRNSDLYFLDKMMHGVGPQIVGLPLPSIIISYMRTTARMRPGETCFGFPRLLSLLFEKLKVNTSTETAVQTKPVDEVTISLLKSLKIPTDFGAQFVRGEASTSAQPQLQIQEEQRAQEEGAGPSTRPVPPPPPPRQSKWQEIMNAICCMETKVMERIDQHEQLMTARLDRHDRRLRSIEDHFHLRRSPTPPLMPHPIPTEGPSSSHEPRGDDETTHRPEGDQADA